MATSGLVSAWDHHVLVAATALLAAAATTALTRFAAVRLGLLAEPNRRSSHATPTPTAGGLGFILPVVGFLMLSIDDYPPALLFATAGVAIALVGFLDDVKDLRRDVRLVAHLSLATGCVALLTDVSLLATAVLILGLAWWINLYNFMDGIDGIAASQSVIYAGGVLVIGEPAQSGAMAWVLLAASLGFLCFNWAPAKIFMGDTGSGFLGVVIGSLALWLWQSGELPAVASLILLVGFWFDASYTLGVRIVTGQAFADAHRSHLYQILSRRWGHGPTTALFAAHAVVWLGPLAALSVSFPAWQVAWLIAACVPAACACIVFRAGARDAG